jgi:WD40 repeat protein
MRQDARASGWPSRNGQTVALFDARTGELVRTLTGHTDRVHAVAFSPDGRSLAGVTWLVRINRTSSRSGISKRGRDGHPPGGRWDVLVHRLRPGRQATLLLRPEGSGRLGSPDGEDRPFVPRRRRGVRVLLLWPQPRWEEARVGDGPAKVRVWEIGSDNQPGTLDGHTAASSTRLSARTARSWRPAATRNCCSGTPRSWNCSRRSTPGRVPGVRAGRQDAADGEALPIEGTRRNPDPLGPRPPRKTAAPLARKILGFNIFLLSPTARHYSR